MCSLIERAKPRLCSSTIPHFSDVTHGPHPRCGPQPSSLFRRSLLRVRDIASYSDHMSHDRIPHPHPGRFSAFIQPPSLASYFASLFSHPAISHPTISHPTFSQCHVLKGLRYYTINIISERGSSTRNLQLQSLLVASLVRRGTIAGIVPAPTVSAQI
jgi:hypothetical protein